MRTLLWGLSFISLSVTAQTYSPPAPSVSVRAPEDESLSQGDLAIDPYTFYANETSTGPSTSHSSNESSPTPMLNEIGEHAPPAQVIAVPTPEISYGPLNPMPELRPAIPMSMPLVDSFTKFQQDVQNNVTTMQKNVQKAAQNIQKNLHEIPRYLVIQGSEFQKKVETLCQKAAGDVAIRVWNQKKRQWVRKTRMCYAGFKKLSGGKKQGFGNDKLTGGNAIDAEKELIKQGFVPVWGRMLKSNLKFPPDLSKLQPGTAFVYASPSRSGKPGHTEWKVKLPNGQIAYVSDYRSTKPGGHPGNKLISILYPPGAKLEKPLGVLEGAKLEKTSSTVEKGT